MNRSKTLLVCIIGVAALLRLYQLGTKSLGVDESFSVLLAERSLAQIWRGDLHPPLYHVMLHFVAMIGRSEWLVRLPSALAGIATVPLSYQFLDRLGFPRAGMWAAVLVAVSPLHIHHSQEARMYSFLVLFCTGSLYCLLRMLQTRSTRSAVGHVVFTVLGLYTHNLAWSTVVAGWAVVAVTEGRPLLRWRGFLAAQAAILFCYLPWATGLFHHATSIASSSAGGDWGRACAAGFVAITDFLSGFSYYLQDSSLHTLCLLTVCLSFIVFLRAMTWRQPNRLFHAATLLPFAIPFAMSMALSWKTGMSHSKYFFPAFVPLMWILGLGLERMQRRRSAALPVYLGMVLILTAASYWKYYGPDQAGRDPWRNISAYIERHWQQGDIAVFNGPYSFYPFAYYTHGSLHWEGMPKTIPPSMQTVAADFGRTEIQRVHRVFLVISPGSQMGIDPRNHVLQWLKENARCDTTKHFGAITLYSFGVRKPS